MPRRTGLVVLCSGCLAGTSLALAAPPAVARALPDLVVSAVSASTSHVAAGHHLLLHETTKNRGSATARTSKTVLLLSKDARRSHGDPVLGPVKVGRLRPGKHVAGKASVIIPASTRAGGYHLIACADGRAAVTESHEGNNCRASGTVTVTATAGPSFPRKADPLTVHATLETEHAVSAPVDHTAPTVLDATATDGTKFHLSIPKDALVGDETITMTPIASISGVPGASGLAGAVRLQPDGLQLLDAATLTITPVQAIPVSRQTGFSATDAGDDFHLYPLGMTRAITLSTMHFSDLGVGSDTAAQQQAIASHMPVRTQAQYEQLEQHVVQQAHDKEVQGQDPGDWIDQLGQLWVGYDRDIIKPLETKAETDDTWAPAAVTQGLAMARQIELMGMTSTEPYKGVHDSIIGENGKIFANAVRQSYQRCIDKHDLSEISRLVSYAHMAALEGVTDNSIFTMAQTCARMELSIHSVVTDTDLGGVVYGFTVDVPGLAFNGFRTSGPSGSTNLTYADWSIYCPSDRYPQITTDGTTIVDSPTEVWGLGITYDIHERRLPSGQIIREVPPPKLLLGLDPGQSREKMTVHWSSGDGGPRDSYLTEWDHLWRDGHKDEGGMSTYPHSLYKIPDWEPQTPGSAVLGTKTYNRTYDDPLTGSTWHETTTLTIRHAPE